MMIRVLRAKAREGKLDELKEKVEKISIPWQKSQKGCLDQYAGTDPHIDEFLMVTLWEDLDSLKAAIGQEYWNRALIPQEELDLLDEVYVHHYEAFGRT